MDERWRFLQPWCRPVRCLLLPEEGRRGHELFIRVDVPAAIEASPSRLRGIRNALMLLSHLVHVDCGAMEYVLEHYCRSCLFKRKNRSIVSPTGFRLTVGNGEEKDWSADMLYRLFCDLDNKPAPGLVMAIRKLASRSQQIGVGLKVPILVEFTDINDINWEAADPGLRVLHELYDKHGSWSFSVNLQPSDLQCSFNISSAKVEALQGGLTPKVAEQICQLVTRDSVLEEVCLNIEDRPPLTAIENPPIYSDWLGNLFHQTLIRGAVKSAAFSISSYLVTHLARLCTALVEAHGVEDVTLKLFFYDLEDMDNWIWECVAFALFSRHARSHSSISEVVLENVCLSKMELEAIAKLLTAEDPFTYFLERLISMKYYHGDNCAQVTSVKRVALMKGSVITLLAMDPEELPATVKFVLEDGIDGVYVLEGQNTDELETAQALVPGYGLCQVSFQDLESVSDSSDSIDQSSTDLVSLSLDFNKRAEQLPEGIPGLLALVGASVTRLKLDLPRSWTLDILDVLRCCPSLECLIITGISINASTLIQGVKDFNVQLKVLKCRFNDDFIVVEELAKPDSPLSRSLREFECRLVTYSHDPERSKFISKFLRTLSSNMMLTKITVIVDKNVSFSVRDRLQQRDLPCAREPFPLSCRVGFISIFRGTQSQQRGKMAKRTKIDDAKPMYELPVMPDQPILKSIFGFAAERAFREVKFEIDEHLHHRTTEDELDRDLLRYFNDA